MKTFRLHFTGLMIFILSLFTTASAHTGFSIESIFSRGPNYVVADDFQQFLANINYARENGLNQYGTGPSRYEGTGWLEALDILAGYPPEIPPNWRGQLNPTGEYAQQQGSLGYFVTRITSQFTDFYRHEINPSYEVSFGNGESLNVESVMYIGVTPDGTLIVNPDTLQPLRELTLVQAFGFHVYTSSNQGPPQTPEQLLQQGAQNAQSVTPIELLFRVTDYPGRFYLEDQINIVADLDGEPVPEPSTWAAIVAVGGIASSVGFRAWRRRSKT